MEMHCYVRFYDTEIGDVYFDLFRYVDGTFEMTVEWSGKGDMGKEWYYAGPGASTWSQFEDECLFPSFQRWYPECDTIEVWTSEKYTYKREEISVDEIVKMCEEYFGSQEK